MLIEQQKCVNMAKKFGANTSSIDCQSILNFNVFNELVDIDWSK